MKNKFFTLTISLFVFIGLSFASYSTIEEIVKNTQEIKIGTSYEKEWKRVDSLTNKGLNKSALELTNLIYKKALQENAQPQLIKAVIHRMKFESFMEEDEYVKAINDLNADCKKVKAPASNILHSMLAETYWRYYQNNRWQFNQRSATINYEQDDIRTWDLRKTVENCVIHYQLSLANKEVLQQTPIEKFYDILNHYEESKLLRPTLYDFLAHRVANFYMNEEASITRPANTFIIDDAKYIASTSIFSTSVITTTDSTSFDYRAIQVLQSIEQFHAQDENKDAIVDATLERLRWVRSKLTLTEKDSLFLTALSQLEKQYAKCNAIAEVMYARANYYVSLPVTDDTKQNKKIAYDIAQQAIKNYPQSYGADLCKSIISTIESKSLHVMAEEVVVPHKPFKVFVEYQNIDKVYTRLVKLDKEKYRKALGDYSKRFKVIDYLLEQPIVTTSEVNLPNNADFNINSVELKADALPVGTYSLLVATSPKFDYEKNAVSVLDVTVSNISYISRVLTNGKTELMVLNRQTGEPIPNVTVEKYHNKYNPTTNAEEKIKLADQQTNNEGVVIIDEGEEMPTLELVLKKDNDVLTINSDYYHNGVYYPAASTSSHIYTDRSIYRQGQVIYFKGLVIESNGKKNTIVKNKKVAVTLLDLNNQKVSSIDVTTNDFGTYSGSFTAPQGLIGGYMRIDDGLGSINISVEEYKRPQFEVTNNPLKGSFQLNDTVTVYGKAKAYSGANIDGASVKYRVVRTARFPYWWYCYRGCQPSSPEMEITSGVTTTNDTGAYNIRFKAIPDLSIDKKSMPTFNYKLYVDVTDINGETHSTQSDVNVGYTNVVINLTTPTTIDLADAKSAKQWKLTTTNLNNVFESSKVNISVCKLQTPSIAYNKRKWAKPTQHLYTKEQWQQIFPLDEYDDENNSLKWAKEKNVFSQEIETKKEEEPINVAITNNWAVGTYLLEATTKDKNGVEVKEIKYITVTNTKSKQATQNELLYTYLNKSSFEPGDTAKLTIGSKREIKVLLEQEEESVDNNVDATIVERKWIKLNNTQQTIAIPIKEKHRGGLTIHLVTVNNNDVVYKGETIEVPYTNKKLDVSFETFRNKLLPGQKEEWRIKIKDNKGSAVAAEMLATLYDASLDAIQDHSWVLDIYPFSYAKLGWHKDRMFGTRYANLYVNEWNKYYAGHVRKNYDELNWFGYHFYSVNNRHRMYAVKSALVEDGLMQQKAVLASPAQGGDMGMPSPKALSDRGPEESIQSNEISYSGARDDGDTPVPPAAQPIPVIEQPTTRKNFNETAFFYPQLQTNEKGELVIAFTIPEALTKWKMLGLAHTKDLAYNLISKELITQKTLMITTNTPRFFREEDQLTFAAKITNLSSNTLKTKVKLELFDAITQRPLSISTTPLAQELEVNAEKSAPVFWNITIPVGASAITYKITAQADNFSDGEENTIPVITNSMLVTESLPLWTNGNETKAFAFTKLVQSTQQSTTLRNHKLTLEYTANPAWYAVQALPYLMEYPYECTDQVFARLYANSLATHIANANPKIKRVFDAWNQLGSSALLSNLEKNQELKSALQEETPWVLDAKDETERKKRIALLFDLNKMASEQTQAINKLEKLQIANGGWSWFAGMPDSRHTTLTIIAGLGHLDALKVNAIRQNQQVYAMIQKAVGYLDNKIREDYENLIKYKAKLSDNNLSYEQIQYLYARSFFKEIPISNQNKKAFNYYLEQSQKYWLKNNRYMQGMIALANYRWNDSKSNITVKDIVKSIKENAITKEEMGMYWKEQAQGYNWYQQPIEQQALMVELFTEVEKDITTVNNLRKWLLKNKQTNDWKTTTATADACYALLLNGDDWLDVENKVDVKLGNIEVNKLNNLDVKEEVGLGYTKISWNNSEIQPSMGNIEVVNKGKSISWGGVYWQYFEKLDKITTSATPLAIKKELFIEKNTATGPILQPIKQNDVLSVGDKIKVRIEIRVDREMQYVHLKDMRASAFEPTTTLSGYKYQDGLGYYETMRDASANFFFEYLPKGTYVFEYALNATQKGNFSNGITTMQCLYAPEFSSHSEGVRISIR